MTRWQKDATSSDALHTKTMGQLLCGLLATRVLIHVEGEIDGWLVIAELSKLEGVEMRAQGAGHVGEARLPQHRIVEQALDQDDFRVVADLLPGIQSPLAAGQETMGEGGAEAAAVEVDDVLTTA